MVITPSSLGTLVLGPRHTVLDEEEDDKLMLESPPLHYVVCGKTRKFWRDSLMCLLQSCNYRQIVVEGAGMYLTDHSTVHNAVGYWINFYSWSEQKLFIKQCLTDKQREWSNSKFVSSTVNSLLWTYFETSQVSCKNWHWLLQQIWFSEVGHLMRLPLKIEFERQLA